MVIAYSQYTELSTTKRMIYLYIRQTVKDYARWKEGFDNHIVARQAGGATDEAYVMRNVDDPNDITVVLGWRDLKEARAFSQSVSLQAAMQKVGIIGSPEIRFLETAV
jgi:hypothetical protein